jgi:hypothetical protein
MNYFEIEVGKAVRLMFVRRVCIQNLLEFNGFIRVLSDGHNQEYRRPSKRMKV